MKIRGLGVRGTGTEQVREPRERFVDLRRTLAMPALADRERLPVERFGGFIAAQGFDGLREIVQCAGDLRVLAAERTLPYREDTPTKGLRIDRTTSVPANPGETGQRVGDVQLIATVHTLADGERTYVQTFRFVDPPGPRADRRERVEIHGDDSFLVLLQARSRREYASEERLGLTVFATCFVENAERAFEGNQIGVPATERLLPELQRPSEHGLGVGKATLRRPYETELGESLTNVGVIGPERSLADLDR